MSIRFKNKIYANSDSRVPYLMRLMGNSPLNTTSQTITGAINELKENDSKVTQTGSISTNADYEILLSKSANDTTETDTVNKASGLTYNPSTNQLKINGTAVLTQHQDISGKVNKSGDTMTGLLTVSTSGESELIVYNSTNNEKAYLYVNSNHNCGIFTDATGFLTIGNSSTLNTLALGNKSDLNYYISNPAGFRSALGFANKTGSDTIIGWMDTSHTAPLTPSGLSGAISRIRYGNIVMVKLSGVRIPAHSSRMDLLPTLPVGWRPPWEIESNRGTFFVEADGSIRMEANNSATQIWDNITFITSLDY